MTEIILDRATYIEFPNDPDILVNNIQIESGSLLLEEILCEKNIVFGETNATRFEATIYNLIDVSGRKIKVYQTDSNGNNRKNIFEGYVDSCKQDKTGRFRKVIAYDAFYSIGNANVAGWWFDFWSTRTTATIKELREDLCREVGISYNAQVSLHNDGFICTKTATLSSVSFNTMLSWICEIQCTVPHIDRNGVLQYIVFTNRQGIDISNDYEYGSSEFEGYMTAAIDTVELYDYDNNLVASTNTTGAVEPKNIYAIKNNSLLFSLVDTNVNKSATEFVLNYLAQVSQIRYTPCNINMIVSNLDLGVGDYISVGDTTSIILQNTLSGSLLIEQEIVASGNEYSTETNRTSTPEYLSITKRTEELKDEIITDDLLNYAHKNDEEYTIESVVTPIISLSIDMPKSSNLVFLATINLESFSTDAREVRETVIIGGQECEIIRREKVPVVVECYFEWNKIAILSNKPTETYSEDGKHLLNLLFFTIGGREAGSVSSFQVFLKATHGRVHIGKNQINATIISKGSSAGHLPWDGTITVEELIKNVQVDKFTANVAKFTESMDNTPDTPTPSLVEQSVGKITVQPSIIRVSGITEAIEYIKP